ncbi:MAG: amino acid--tRNA ligase-related protein, partial [bacterium]
ADTVSEQIGALRFLVGKTLMPNPEPKYSLVWVHTFPLYKFDEHNKPAPAHHPFTRPFADDLPLLDTDPMKVRAHLYDLTLNGEEIAGGGLRIYNRALQEKVLEHAGYSKEVAAERFGFFLDALEYGAPPHGGIAWGLDRLITIIAGGESLRDVIAFPKTTTGQCPLTGAPAPVDPAQLKELKLRIDE